MQENQTPSSDQKNQITFSDFDKLKLTAFAEDLLQAMEKGTHSAITDIGQKGGYTVSLNAEFGNGKTTFLKMFEDFIKKEQQNNYDVLFVNAWESDFCEEPVTSILSEFINWIEAKYKNLDESNKKKMIITKKKVIGILGNIANQIIYNQTGVDANKIKSNSALVDKSLASLGDSILHSFNLRKQTIQKVKAAFNQYVETREGRKLLIIVDELDRTRPDYAVRFMEDMKHFFDIENVIFLVAVNKTQMEATVKCLYGQGLGFNGYYRKFFKQEIDLPDPYKDGKKLIDNLIKKTKINYKTNDRNMSIDHTYWSCKTFNLTLREVEQCIRILSMVLDHDQKSAQWIYMDCYSFFTCLFMKQKEVFNKILNGGFTMPQFVDFLNTTWPEIKTLKDIKDFDLLLAAVACSFLVNSQNKIHYKPSEDEIKYIQKLAPSIHEQTINYICSREEGGFDLMEEQPVLKICQNIQQCKSHF